MGARFPRIVISALGVTLVLLAGCDSKPNPNFEQAVKDQAENKNKSADPYASLAPSGGLKNFLRADRTLRQSTAAQQAMALGSTYNAHLRRLRADKSFAGVADLLAGCSPLFDQAAAFQSDKNLDAQAAKARGTQLSSDLSACRDRAVEKDGADEDTKKALAVIRRFASTGMMLVGVATIAHGEEREGLAVWTQAERLISEDRPGFELKPNMFLKR